MIAYTELINLSIVIAFVILSFRIKIMDGNFLPFFLLVLTASANEVISIIATDLIHNSNINNNIYVLAEGLLIIWQFQKWNLFANHRNFFFILIASLCTVWAIEIFIISKITYIASYYRIFYSFVIALISINKVNQLIISENRSLLKSPAFLICSAFIIYFTYKVLIEAFWLYGLNFNADFRANVYGIHMYINLFANLIFAVAALWVPKKQVFIQPF
jgi:hypothetical protein